MPDIGQALLDAQVLTPEQLQQAAGGGGPLVPALVRQNLVEEQRLVQVLCSAFGLEEARIESIEPDPEATKLVPQNTARSLGMIPLKKEGAMLHAATFDPSNDRAVDRLARSTGLSVKLFVVGPKAFEEALPRFYGGGGGGSRRASRNSRKKAPHESGPSLRELDQNLKFALQEVDDADPETPEELIGATRLEVNDLDPPVVRLVNALLLKALKMRASDIHVETMEEDLRVRFRIDGALVEILRASGEIKSALASRIKIMSEMDIAEKRIPQDGAIKVALGDNNFVDFRVNTLPNIYGEKIVMRILGTSELRDNVDELGFDARSLELVREAIINPYGMVLVTGPTGSGKTTTLYTILNQLNEVGVNLVTAEDPVEYRLDGVTQVNVRPNVGLTFDAALRSFLRQDPDIILVGEMRDYETSAIAVKAALTGHLVLSTLHTNDAPSTVVRLVDMGIEPYLVASAVKLVIAQRLLRRICTECKTDVDLSELERTDLDQATLASVEYLARGTGCEACNNLGYRGRVPVFEVMAVKTKDMRRAITEGGTEVQVAQIARREGMQSLAEGAIELVNQGITSLEEAMSVIVAD